MMNNTRLLRPKLLDALKNDYSVLRCPLGQGSPAAR